MPLVFVHGVNTRKGSTPEQKAAFRAAVAARDEWFRSVSLAGLVRPPASLSISNPYWGEYGASFAYGLASLPIAATEAFGPREDEVMARLLMETLPASAAARVSEARDGEQSVLLTLAREEPRRTLPLALDAVVAAAANRSSGDPVKDNDRIAALGEFAKAAVAYFRSDPNMSWLYAKRPKSAAFLIQDDVQFLEQLIFRINSAANAKLSGDETFGGASLLEHLKAGRAALGSVAKATASAITAAVKGAIGAGIGAIAGSAAGALAGGSPGTLVRAVRPGATQRVGIFLGDIFVYLQQRGTIEAPGPIVKEVRDALRDSFHKKRTDDPKLVVVAHSMGGNIVYDIVTHYDSAVEIDLLVTVGSQVGVFKEMRLYKEDENQPRIPDNPGKVKKPTAIRQWLNVFDPLDVLGFAAEAVFEGVKDFAYSNQASPLDAHSLYFQRLSFHERLNARITELGIGPVA